MSGTGGDRHGEFILDSSDRNRRSLDGGADPKGTNLIAGAPDWKDDEPPVIRQRLFSKLAERHIESIGR